MDSDAWMVIHLPFLSLVYYLLVYSCMLLNNVHFTQSLDSVSMRFIAIPIRTYLLSQEINNM